METATPTFLVPGGRRDSGSVDRVGQGTEPPVRVLGPVAVADRLGAGLKLGPARQRAVLAALLLDARRPVSRSDLIGRVWGDEPPPAAEQALRSYLCRLRKVVQTSTALRLDRRDGGYVAVVDGAQLDLTMFRDLASRARVAVRDGRHDEALTDYGLALALAPGSLLIGVGSDWLDERRRLLERERHTVALERNDLALMAGMPQLVVDDAPGRLAQEPYDERLVGQAMLALARFGRTADALAVFRRTRELLAVDLGIDPSPALQDVHGEVLRGIRPAAAPTGTAVVPRLVPRQLPPMPSGFVDRDTESDALDEMLLTDDEGPAVVVICGPGGAGKTALAVRWARRHADRFPDGQLFLDLHGFDIGCRPTSPEIALRGLLAGLGVDPAGIPADLTDMVSAYRTLLADRRVLLVADDVNTAAQVRPLLPPGCGSAVVLTSRSGLPSLVATVGARVLPVGLLDTAAARELVTRRLGRERTAAEPVAVDRLVAHCGRLPLALAIVAGQAAALPSMTLTSLADDLDDEARRLAALSTGDVGTDLGAVVAGSLAALTATARSVLTWLACGPRLCIQAPLVAALAELSEDHAVDTLRELLGLHLIEPDGPSRFRLHDLVRLAVRSRPLTGLDTALDRVLAQLIADLPGRGQDPSDLLAAAAYAEQTGRDAALCDLADALELPLGSAGRWAEMAQVSDRAVGAAVRLEDDHRQATALIGRGRGAIGLRRFGAAQDDLTAALAAAETTDDLGLQARAHRALARLAAHQHEFEDALQHDRRALELHRRNANALGVAHAYNAIGWHLAHLGRAVEGLASCCRGLLIFVEHDDRSGQALTQDSIGYALDRLGRSAEACAAYATAADLCRELGWQVALANTLLRLADASRRTGDDHVAEAAQEEAAAILRLTGRDLLEPSHGAAATIPSPVAASPAWPSADDSHPARAAS